MAATETEMDLLSAIVMEEAACIQLLRGNDPRLMVESQTTQLRM